MALEAEEDLDEEATLDEALDEEAVFDEEEALDVAVLDVEALDEEAVFDEEEVLDEAAVLPAASFAAEAGELSAAVVSEVLWMADKAVTAEFAAASHPARASSSPAAAASIAALRIIS